MKFDRKKVIITIITFCFINSCAFLVYKRAGVFYDIPELEVKANDVQRGMWADYCDRGYDYDKDFSDSIKKPKWLVIGNSFGRDFINIILESELKDSIDLSYAYEMKDNTHLKRLQEADMIFISTKGLNRDLVNNIKSKKSSKARLIVVGEKNFGISNGLIFKNRNKTGYLNSTIEMQKGYYERNKDNVKEYSDNFIDLIGIATANDGKIRVFSEDGRFISQDCLHLTKAGAQFFANKIDWSSYYDNHN